MAESLKQWAGAGGKWLVAAMLGLVLTADLQAQQTTTFGLAVYIPQPAVIAVDRPLAFGRLWPGVVATVQPTTQSASAAQVRITGAACAYADVRFVLPTHATGPGGAMLPLDSFAGEWDTAFEEATEFVPSGSPTRFRFDHSGLRCTGPEGAYGEEEDGLIMLRLGATARPGFGQAGGRYSSTLTIQVTYVDL